MKKKIYFTHDNYVMQWREGKGFGKKGNKMNSKVPEIQCFNMLIVPPLLSLIPPLPSLKKKTFEKY